MELGPEISCQQRVVSNNTQSVLCLFISLPVGVELKNNKGSDRKSIWLLN